MRKERSTRIIKFVNLGAGVLVLGRNGLISHLVKMHLSKIILCSRASIRQTYISEEDVTFTSNVTLDPDDTKKDQRGT